jgi:hypothetical protein
MGAKLSLTDQAVLTPIESSLYMPTVPGKLEALIIPGVTGRYSTHVSGGFINRVGQAHLSIENADMTIEAVRAHFAAHNQRFSWFVTELSSPADLTTRLERAGFTKGIEIAGMFLTNLTQPITLNPAVRVQKANTSEYDLVSELYQKAFPLEPDVADLFVELIDAMGAAHYLASLEGADEPVGAASMFYLSNLSIMILETAATLQAYRGQGVYKSLLARRLADAYADAMQIAVTQAFRTTSYPILSKLGFVERCNITVYFWDPAEAA